MSQPSSDWVDLDLPRSLTRAIVRHYTNVGDEVTAFRAARPDDPLGPALAGLLQATCGRREASLAAASLLTEARTKVERLGRTDASRSAVIAALGAAVAGERRLAAQYLDRLLSHRPDHVLFLKLAHTLKFMAGDLPGMSETLSLVLPRLDEDHPERGPVLGMQAFVSEEQGDYRRAEELGRAAVDLAADDVWGIHAVGHLFEMTDRPEEGIRWLESHGTAAARCNNFRFHIAWHRALFHLSLGQTERVLQLYDEEIRAVQSDDYRDISNGASLLWRLTLEGIEVGDRWTEMADFASNRIEDGELIFADLHYLLALIGADRREEAGRLVQAMQLRAAGESEQSKVLAGGGAALADGLYCLTDDMRDPDEAWIRFQATGDLAPIGGSLAQRDVFERSRIEAATRSDPVAATTLLRYRLDRRSNETWGRNRLVTLNRQPSARESAPWVAPHHLS